MKPLFVFLILFISVTVRAQSLKDLLYSGKLKSDSGTVVRRTDDLNSKIDTTTKKAADTVKTKSNPVVKDSLSNTVPGAPADSPAAGTAPVEGVAANKDNNKIWKDYMDTLASNLKSEVLPSKKIKSGSYYVLVEYEIAPDGQVAVNNISSSPESSFLVQQIKERVSLTAPQLLPVVTNGKARKVTKKYTLTLSKQ